MFLHVSLNSLSSYIYSYSYLLAPSRSVFLFSLPRFQRSRARPIAGTPAAPAGPAPSDAAPSLRGAPGDHLPSVPSPPLLHLESQQGRDLWAGRRASRWASPWNRGRRGREGQRRAEKGRVPALSPSAPPAAGRPFDVAGPAGMRPGYQSPSWIPKVSA